MKVPVSASIDELGATCKTKFWIRKVDHIIEEARVVLPSVRENLSTKEPVIVPYRDVHLPALAELCATYAVIQTDR